MKNVRKVLTLMLSAVMMMALTINAFAASISIEHDKTWEENTDQTYHRVYNAYKIFDASYDELEGENTQGGKDDFTYTPDDAAVSYSMKKNNPWVDVMKLAGQTWFTVTEDANGDYVVVPKVDKDTDGTVTKEYYATAADAKDFADFLLENMPEDLDPDKTVTVDAGEVTVDPGYYLIVAKDDADAATRLALVTTDVTMIEKNTYIKTTKTAKEAAYQIGDKVEYNAEVTIPLDTALTQLKEGSTTEYAPGHGPVVLHDVMDSTLTFAGSIKEATVEGNAFTGYTLVWTEDTNAVNHTTAQADGCTFEIVIPVTADLLGKTVKFTYEAEVNSSAAGEDGLVNELKGEINDYNTNPDSPVVYTFDFSFKKIFDGSEDKDLTATFVLQDATGAVIPLTKIDDTHYAVKDSDDTAVTDNLITIKNGQEVNIKGLKGTTEGVTYKLVEKSTDTGYNLLDAPVEVVVKDTTTWGNGVIVGDPSRSITVDGEELDDGVYTFDVTNMSGTVLPSTGGIGTTMFYVIGAALVLGAGIVMVSKRRMDA